MSVEPHPEGRNWIYPYRGADGERIGWLFWCPGCECSHSYITEPGRSGMHADGTPGPLWTFNGDEAKPTFRNSLGVKDWDPDTGDYLDGYRCHLYVTDGMIEFLSDCKHKLAGQTVPLVPHPHLPSPEDME